MLIACPTMGSIMKSKTATTIAFLMRDLTRWGVSVDYVNIDGADITKARNLYADLLLKGKQEWLLFVDSDMRFSPQLVVDMLNCEEMVVAAIYARREIPTSPVVQVRWDERFSPLKTGYVAAVGMGCTLIRRQVFEAMIAAGVVEQRIDIERSGEVVTWGFFDPVVVNGAVPLTEDYSFCHRWTFQMEGKIWGIANADIGHVGDFIYKLEGAAGRLDS